ncbi:hypothetical protein DCAR_0623728 [Daucus carota subsp. sativus]|uniref:Uncharacterized protein n=1 Tax=Daucus carota subsp. sativus TaxID=79200 RepID=A0A161ZRB0_DAUCS|nr:hypothetical protein DCAR_0623728 [Daucus carota subsp. sativus]
MERHILRSLEGVIGQLTPFDFLQCLAHDLLQSNILFAPFTPFTIALSAILCTISYDDHKSAAIEELQAHGVGGLTKSLKIELAYFMGHYHAYATG